MTAIRSCGIEFEDIQDAHLWATELAEAVAGLKPE